METHLKQVSPLNSFRTILALYRMLYYFNNKLNYNIDIYIYMLLFFIAFIFISVVACVSQHSNGHLLVAVVACVSRHSNGNL